MRPTRKTSFPQLLWDLIQPARQVPSSRPTPPKNKPAAARDNGSSLAGATMQQKYDRMVETMKQRHGVRIRKWRNRTTGCAWEVRYADGSLSRLIESPYPRGPMSAAVFLHEIGHHAIGFHRYKPRCLEEYMAWRWALDAMEELGLTVTPAVQRRFELSMHYAVAKAMRRGLKQLPAPLMPFILRPIRPSPAQA